MIIRTENAEFIRSAAKRSDFPSDGKPQIVMAGRSNVGKSSMINCLLNRKSMARVSSEPGKTANINLFLIDKTMYLVDLPGYGYAKVSQNERERWGVLMGEYFEHSGDICLGILITDIRHAPTESDITMAGLYEHYKIPYIVVMNKADKLNKTELSKSEETARESFKNNSPLSFITFSALKRTGRNEVLNAIFAALGEG
ncbi:MAG: YihA family ribosome biogenesis GTP-binding protein [Clostridiales bacterium]|nr:YihA family ribosome biogenesis GTP-binding protein [Clostridiales bacterium]